MLLSTAIVVGLLGSVHCLGMCAPIVWALPDDRSARWQWLGKKLVYNIGRIITYAILGVVVGFAGEMLAFAGVQQWLSIVAGVVLIVGVLLFGGRIPELPLFRPLGKLVLFVRTKMGRLIARKGLGSHFYLGMINGLLPCGLVYAALIAAISMGSWSGGALYMILFGLGTFPMMIAAAVVGRVAGQRFKWRLSSLTPKFIMILGLLFVLRGLNLGIPYLSPALTDNNEIIECNVNIDRDSFAELEDE